MKLSLSEEYGPSPKDILYVDMDGVLVDFKSGINRLNAEAQKKYSTHPEDAPGVFALMDPLPGAIEALERLRKKFDIYILSTAPWANPSGWADKLEWVKMHLDSYFEKRLILCHHKNLLKGSYLIDDRHKHGADIFGGEWIHFDTAEFPDWSAVLEYLDV